MPYLDPEDRRRQGRRAYAADPEKFRERKRAAYAEQHPHVRSIRPKGGGLTNREAQIVRHGMSLRGHAALLEYQGGLCAICGAASSNGRGVELHIDHDHACCKGTYSCGSCIRGLLCFKCNTANGALDWPTSRLVALVRYRNDPPWAAVVARDPSLVHPKLWG